MQCMLKGTQLSRIVTGSVKQSRRTELRKNNAMNHAENCQKTIIVLKGYKKANWLFTKFKLILYKVKSASNVLKITLHDSQDVNLKMNELLKRWCI